MSQPFDPNQPQQPWGQQPQGYGQPPQAYYAQQPPKKKRRLWLWLVGGLVLLLALLGGCVAILGSAVDNYETSGVGVSTEEPAADDPSTDEPSTTGPPAENYQAKLGNTFEWEDGVKVQMDASMEVDPKQQYVTKKDTDFLALKIKITNGSGKRIDVGLASANVTYGADGESAETATVYGDDKYDNYFEGKLSPGKSKTVYAAYKVTKKQAKDLTVEFAPGWLEGYEPVEYTGSAK